MKRKFIGTKSDAIALSTFVKLMRATDAVSQSTHRHLMDVNLTISQFGILEALYHLGPMCQRDIAKKILKSTANITTVIDNLEKRGLVKRKRSKEDRRYINLHLTNKGLILIESVIPDHFQGIIDRLQLLTTNEQKQLATLCKKLGVTADNPA